MPNVESLQQLKRVVEAVPEKQFDMTVFGTTNQCGTVGCALGHAALDPWFAENTPIATAFPIRPDPPAREFGVFDWASASQGVDAFVGECFGISSGDVYSTFYPDRSNVTKGEVIANIDRLIDGRAAEPYAAEPYDD